MIFSSIQPRTVSCIARDHPLTHPASIHATLHTARLDTVAPRRNPSSPSLQTLGELGVLGGITPLCLCASVAKNQHATTHSPTPPQSTPPCTQRALTPLYPAATRARHPSKPSVTSVYSVVKPLCASVPLWPKQHANIQSPTPPQSMLPCSHRAPYQPPIIPPATSDPISLIGTKLLPRGKRQYRPKVARNPCRAYDTALAQGPNPLARSAPIRANPYSAIPPSVIARASSAASSSAASIKPRASTTSRTLFPSASACFATLAPLL